LIMPRDNRARKARLSVEQYMRIADSGALDAFGKTELIRGEIRVVNSQYMPHMRAKLALYRALYAAVTELALPLEVGSEGAARLGDDSMPEPDVFICAPTNELAAPASAIKLVIEVADATVRQDMGPKRRLYAEHAIPEYWVVLLNKRRVERFADPRDGDYARQDGFGFGDAVDSVTLPGVRVPAGTLG
jgi:Uma2 family endonuclease